MTVRRSTFNVVSMKVQLVHGRGQDNAVFKLKIRIRSFFLFSIQRSSPMESKRLQLDQKRLNLQSLQSLIFRMKDHIKSSLNELVETCLDWSFVVHCNPKKIL